MAPGSVSNLRSDWAGLWATEMANFFSKFDATKFLIGFGGLLILPAQIGCMPSGVQATVSSSLKKIRENRGETKIANLAAGMLENDGEGLENLMDSIDEPADEHCETDEFAAEPPSERTNPFEYPDGVSATKAETTEGATQIKLFGFAGSPAKAILSINGSTHLVGENESVNGVQVEQVQQPWVSLRVDNQNRRLSLIESH